MTGFDPGLLRGVRTLKDVLAFFAQELDWPTAQIDIEDATFGWTAEELGIPGEQVPRLLSLRQLRPLSNAQPWGIFFLELSGRHLPVTPLRRLLQALVRRRRAHSDSRTWDLDDLLFVTATDTGESVELHLVAFFDNPAGGAAEMRSLPWNPEHSPPQHLSRLASELLPRLEWPTDPTDVEDWRTTWRDAFRLRHGEALRSAARLAQRMAETAHLLRDRIEDAVVDEPEDGPFRVLLGEIREELVADVNERQFADMCAQTLVYGALTARVIDPEAFGASPMLSSVPLANPFLSAFFEQVHDQVVALDLDAAGFEGLVADLRETDVEAILDQFGATAAGGDPVIHFYETFLAEYDPGIRAEVGAFYTPQAVVATIVRAIDGALRERFGLTAGIADTASWAQVCARTGCPIPDGIVPETPFVSALDPATGTGTFLVEWIRRARASFEAAHPSADWPAHLREHVLPGLKAFELMLAPFAIAHLKVALEVGGGLTSAESSSILLTDSLELPGPVASLEGLDPVAREGQRAAEIKRSGIASVVMGNPPYRRLRRDDGGGWVTRGEGDRPALMQDIIDIANARTNFAHVASLYNLYVYFWRFALWKAFEQHPEGPGVVGFITGSSWLDAPGFVGLREAARSLCSEIWIIDLAGDNRGTRRDENVFAIETPVAIAILMRAQRTNSESPATIRFCRLEGTSGEKLDAISSLGLPTEAPDAWAEVPSVQWRSFRPTVGGAAWEVMPRLTDLLPWQQPGAKLNRTWPVAPDERTLDRRWQAFLDDEDPAVRGELFPNPGSGRRIDTSVGDLPPLSTLPARTPRPHAARYQWRPFDTQWTIEDPRLAKTESPSLWQSRSDRQLFFSAIGDPGTGPALQAFTSAPDLHQFHGRGGKDILPLYRDASADEPNLAAGLLDALGSALGGEQVEPEDVAAYLFALLSTPGYQRRFELELGDKEVRVPMTADAALFAESVALGRKLLWLHTRGERFGEGRGALPECDVILIEPVAEIPESLADIEYNEAEQMLWIGDACVAGVSAEVWNYSVSGWQVVRHWLGHRTVKGRPGARRGSELDAIRPDRWDESWTDELLDLLRILTCSLELQTDQDALLDRVLAGELIPAADLPQPTEAERTVPKTIRAGSSADQALFDD